MISRLPGFTPSGAPRLVALYGSLDGAFTSAFCGWPFGDGLSLYGANGVYYRVVPTP